MSTHKITPETKVPFPCWLKLSIGDTADDWYWREMWSASNHPSTYGYTHYSTNPPDQPPLGEPAPEGSLPVTNAQYTGKHPKDNATGYDDSPLPTPSAPSLQSVAEGAANEIQAVFYKESWGAVIPNPATVKEILTRHFAPLLTERDDRIGRLERELAMANDAANKGDRARDIADAQDQIIAELRASLQIEREAGSALRTRCEELERDKERLESLFERGEVVLGRSEDGDVMLKWRDKCYYGTDVAGAVAAARKEGQQAHEKGEGV